MADDVLSKEDIDEFVSQVNQELQQAAKQAQWNDLDAQGSLALTVRSAYKKANLPYVKFSPLFHAAAKRLFSSFPSLVYDQNDECNGIGVALSNVYINDFSEHFARRHQPYLTNLTVPGSSRFSKAVFVPLPRDDPNRPPNPNMFTAQIAYADRAHQEDISYGERIEEWIGFPYQLAINCLKAQEFYAEEVGRQGKAYGGPLAFWHDFLDQQDG